MQRCSNGSLASAVRSSPGNLSHPLTRATSGVDGNPPLSSPRLYITPFALRSSLDIWQACHAAVLATAVLLFLLYPLQKWRSLPAQGSLATPSPNLDT